MCTCSNVGAYGGAASFSGSGESWMDPAVTTHLIVVCASLQAKPQEKLAACGSKILLSLSLKINTILELNMQINAMCNSLSFKKNLDFGLSFVQKVFEDSCLLWLFGQICIFLGQFLNHRIAFITPI